MSNKRRISSAIAALALAAAGAIVSAPAAQALGTVDVKCTNYDTTTGYSSKSNGGFTTNGAICGKAKARLFYTTYPGSPTCYTSWVYSSTTAFVSNPGNTVGGGNHGVADPAWAFPGAKNFNS